MSANSRVSNEFLELKITLRGIKPRIWRRIQVPKEFTFEKLHFFIQAAMGWHSCHLYKFDVRDPIDATKFMEFTDEESVADSNYYRNLLPGFNTPSFNARGKKIGDFFRIKGDSATYTYDFCDDWIHNVVLEKTVVLDSPFENYPKILAGRRACPPEDCGGASGYKHLLKVVGNPNHEEHEELKSWLDKICEGYDPEKYDQTTVHFNVFLTLLYLHK